jgi:hypothetical protein
MVRHKPVEQVAAEAEILDVPAVNLEIHHQFHHHKAQTVVTLEPLEV